MNELRVVAVSHGFQANYEAGFVNGVAQNGIGVCLAGSDTTLVADLDPRVQMLNLRGSQSPARTKLTKATNMLHYHWRLMALVFRHRPAVVHVIGLYRAPFWMGVVQACMFRWSSRRLLLTVHNLLPHNRHTRWNRYIYHVVYRVPNTLVVHTTRMKEDLQREFAIDAERIVVMEHGIRAPAAPDSTARSAMRATLGVSDDAVCLLFFGALSPYKGLDAMLGAFADLPAHYVLVIAGRFPGDEPAYRRAILDGIACHPSAERIVMREGYVEERDVPRYYAAADVVVLPYRHIDQSGILLQAMSFGVPVIAYPVGAFSLYLHGERGAVSAQCSPAALGAALRTLPAPLTADKRARIAQCAEEYLWSHTVRSVLPFYSEERRA